MAALGLGAGFALVTAAATTGLTTAIDTRIILAARTDPSAPLTALMRAASWLGAGPAIPLAVLIAMALRWRRGERTAWLYFGACLSGWALNIALKGLTHRPRPMGISPKLTAAGFYSYPSGHAMLAILVFGFGAFLFARTVRSPAVRYAVVGIATLITLLIGIARIYLGAHWPTDVLGGLLAGAGWAAACTVFAEHGAVVRVRAGAIG